MYYKVIKQMQRLMELTVMGFKSEEEKPLELLVPDFDNMPSWTKVEIADHADAYGITLDTKKRKADMIADFREKYQNNG
jgi:hypothetical protein